MTYQAIPQMGEGWTYKFNIWATATLALFPDILSICEDHSPPKIKAKNKASYYSNQPV